jgi:hypothetical protein
MHKKPTPSPESFNAALLEAVERRNQWQLPIAVWMHSAGVIVPTGTSFDARAHTVPPSDPHDTLLCELHAEALDDLTLLVEDDDQTAFDQYVSELLESIQRRQDLQ